MFHTIAHVESRRLYQAGQQPPIDIGTPDWFSWLERQVVFTFIDAAGAFTAYKRPPYSVDSPWDAGRIGDSWSARLELGPSRELTLARLQAVARTLADRHQAGTLSEADQDATLPAAAGPVSSDSLPPERTDYWTPARATGLLGGQLTRPRLPTDVIKRPRLLAHLDAGLSVPLTLVCAPAGSGKTTLLVQWLATLSLPAAWLSLAPADNELPRFVHALASALQHAIPGACPEAARLLGAPRFPPLAEVLALLTGELADLPSDVVVVLDDAHLLVHKEVLSLLAGLLEHPPAQLHLVFSTRTPPPLPLARWRARGQLVELGAAELHLTWDETAAFLVRLLDEPMVGELVAALSERTGGWPALVRLAALSLRQAPDRVSFLARQAQVPERAVSDYLVEEVLAPLTPDARAVLERLALLEDLNAALAAATLGGEVTAEQVQTLLEEWARAGLVMAPPMEQPGWYRLHPLLKQVVQQRVQVESSPEERAALHRRASAWYAKQGRLDEALREALSAGDGPEAARLLVAHFLPIYEQEQWEQLERWLDLVPEEQVQQSPILLFARAWVLQVHGQLQKLPELLSAAEQLVASGAGDARERDDAQSTLPQALIALGWAHFQYFSGQVQESLQSARAALQWISPGEGLLATHAHYYLALSYQAAGQEERALSALNKALRDPTASPNNGARLLFVQATLYLMAGKLPQVEQLARYLLRLTQESELALSQNYAHWLLGAVAYEHNDLETAVYHFSAVLAHRQRTPLRWVLDALCGLALAYYSQGHDTEARATRDELLDWVRDQHNLPQLFVAYTFAARLALAEGEVEQAKDWLELAGEHTVAGPMLFLENPPITRARLLLASGDEASLGKGQALLDELLQHMEATHNTYKIIKVLALQAWACEFQGQRSEALAVLERALEMGRPAGFVRTFADLPQLAPLLTELRKRRTVNLDVDKRRNAYLERLLAAMHPVAAYGTLPEELLRKEGLEPLTRREMDILRLLQRDFSNKEIARVLVVTPGTVKVHTANLYRKLGVENRRAAVTVARALRLLARDESGAQEQ